MTTGRASIDDLAVVRHILSDSTALLLDFDGPICKLFSDVPAHFVADELRKALGNGNSRSIPTELKETGDPFEILHYAATIGSPEAGFIETTLRALEVEAVAAAQPTPSAHEVIESWQALGRKIAVVSNNSRAAVNAYLHQHQLAGMVHAVSARTDPNPELLKPNAHLLAIALTDLQCAASDSVLIGDSPSDIVAAHRARVASIGYANKYGKTQSLAAANALVSHLGLVKEAIKSM